MTLCKNSHCHTKSEPSHLSTTIWYYKSYTSPTINFINIKTHINKTYNHITNIILQNKFQKCKYKHTKQIQQQKHIYKHMKYKQTKHPIHTNKHAKQTNKQTS